MTNSPIKITIKKDEFNKAYEQTVIKNNFFEVSSYYENYRPRYFNTLKFIEKFTLPESPKILEISGGQISLLLKEMFNFDCTVADVNDQYKQGIIDQGINFLVCDLLHDDILVESYYDLIVMCEVIEHLPVPPNLILEKLKKYLKPGGWLILTTPNFYRFRNLVRMITGTPIFCPFFQPRRGEAIGHFIEYSKENLQWSLEKAGFKSVQIEYRQLDFSGATLLTKLARIIISPLFIRPLWRDNLVANAQKP
ncbi:class I SAM-dependent methyltransferase [Gloeothece verrucosa]|uniref:Methyltransferase type 12 n=1 Tax=Gloeothece verrucosa (strain PCC 7822) TaxID=497965 RepID=E0UK01_GLOV7|nr:class I SAM-dependent methyltransferase [Gloeothece verrucosa]ADN14637.1 Methyltransferase type 12 [Gloeothece verrucosa PCC 7822]